MLCLLRPYRLHPGSRSQVEGQGRNRGRSDSHDAREETASEPHAHLAPDATRRMQGTRRAMHLSVDAKAYRSLRSPDFSAYGSKPHFHRIECRASHLGALARRRRVWRAPAARTLDMPDNLQFGLGPAHSTSAICIRFRLSSPSYAAPERLALHQREEAQRKKRLHKSPLRLDQISQTQSELSQASRRY
jgi:hypothetical protein